MVKDHAGQTKLFITTYKTKRDLKEYREQRTRKQSIVFVKYTV